MTDYSVDIETEGLNAQKFLLGVITDTKGTHEVHYNSEDMWTSIKQKIAKAKANKERAYFYGHNHEYDFAGYTKGHLTDPLIEFINSETFIVGYDNAGLFLDTFPFYRMSLEKAGEIIGEQKLGKPTSMGRKPQNPEEWKELETYCIQDTNVTIELIQTIRRELKKLGFNPRKIITPGQVGMTAWQTWLKKSNNPWRHIFTITTKNGRPARHIIKSNHRDKIRMAYRGGRVEAYKLGTTTNVTGVDKRSLYPYVMSTMRFPDLRTESFIRAPLAQGYTTDQLFSTIGVSRVTIKAPHIPIGLLPVRHGDENIYPTNSTITANYTHLELHKALQHKYTIHHVHWSILYEDGPNPFTDYIHLLYEQRLHAPTPAAAHIIKLLMNSLSGKFSQTSINKDIRIIPRQDADKWFSQGYKATGQHGNHYYVEKPTGVYEPSYANPLISALITAQGRCYTWDYLNAIGMKDLVYCDTDGIYYIGNHDGLFTFGNTLADWKKDTDLTLTVKGKKNYIVTDTKSTVTTPHVSGVRPHEITPDTYATDTTVTIHRMVSIKEAAKTGNLDNAGTFVTTTQLLHKDNTNAPLKEYEEPEEDHRYKEVSP